MFKNQNNIIIFQDSRLIVCNKPPGMPTQNDKTRDLSLYEMIKGISNNNIHLINRIDRPVSGLVLFAKDKSYYLSLKNIWHSDVVSKEYIAIVQGKWETPVGTLENYIQKGRGHKAIINPKGKRASLKFQLVDQLDNYSILKINLITGRFHQIRCQLSHRGFPVKGDIKYGARRKNDNRSIHLHSYRLKIPDYDLFEAPISETDNLWRAVSSILQKD